MKRDKEKKPSGDAQTIQTARAVWFIQPGMIEVREEKLQGGHGQVFVQSKLQAISHGTEMLIFRGKMPEGIEADAILKSLGGNLRFPIKYGYINTGLTDSGKKVFAFYPHQDIFYIDRSDFVILPSELSFEDAVFLAHMETAVSIIQDTTPVFGDSILILGQGTVGILITELLRLCSYEKIIAIDRYKMRRDASEKLGCTVLSPKDPDLIKKIYELTEGRGIDRIINVSGAPDALQIGMDTAAFEGTIVEASWYGKTPITLGLGTSFHRKRLTVRSSQVSRINPALTGSWDKKRRLHFAIDLLSKIRPSKYITHRFNLGASQQAYELIDQHPEQVIQVVLEPEKG